MRVFISSVRRGLEEERDALPGLIAALGHEPTRFEDYTAMDVPSRQACLAGVEEADAYLLLLGASYGDRLSDTGLAPTEEEFTVARRRGIPVLAFRKTGVQPDPDQAAFISRVEDYATGKFRGAFSRTHELLTRVTETLRVVEKQPSALRWTPLKGEVEEPEWITPTSDFRGYASGGTILEVHALPVGERARLRVQELDHLGRRLATMLREQGFFATGEALSVDASDRGVIVEVPGQPRGDRGARILRDRSIAYWTTLPRDTLGTIIDRVDIAGRVETLIRNISETPVSHTETALAVSLAPLDFTSEGSSQDLGRRTGASIGITSGQTARVPPEDSVAFDALPQGAPEIAAEITARLLHVYRRVRRH